MPTRSTPPEARSSSEDTLSGKFAIVWYRPLLPWDGARVETSGLHRQHILDLFDLTGRTAIITGGSRGIGFALARGFAAVGANVVISSRKADACEAAAKEIIGAGGEALAVPGHTGRLDDLAHLVDRTVERFGGVDIVVNNAANALGLPISEITPEAWAKTQDSNERGPLFLVKFALPHLVRSKHAAVLNVVTAGVFLNSGGRALYAAAKSGLLTLTRAMAAEFAPQGIRVNALAPGTVDTDMVRNTGAAAQESMEQASAMRRIATPEEMIGPALFLVSEAASYVTGTVLLADGGLAYH
jgi:NAD(P)-dependent dehydrogenase (short-subunit alcohol dehydrogenase family)